MTTSYQKLPFIYAKRHGVVVDVRDEQAAKVLFHSLPSPVILAEVQRFLGDELPWESVSHDEFEQALNIAYHSNATAAQKMVEGLDEELDLVTLADAIPEMEDLLEKENDAPIIRLINALLTEAVREEVSDIHIEPYEKRLVVRFRKDGVLREVLEPKRALAPLLVSRIKVMAKLDIAEKRIPQDGRISLKVAGREVDIRVSTMPASDGERVVLRLLDKKAGRLNLLHLGMSNRDRDIIQQLIKKPHGIILVTGPTGSGKTTTLYAALSALNEKSRNILTVEDPIEYNLEGIGQTQVNTKIDMTFARGLRAILRQDPDVVMVGEIRDVTTAEIAVQASLTGHLVLSTLHTNSAVGAITRLIDMGIEPFLIASSLIGVAAQRLVRLLCPECKEAHQADHGELSALLQQTMQNQIIYRAVGCEACQGLGYKGRMGIYEIAMIDEEIRRMIHDRESEQAIEQYVRSQSPSIRQDGRDKVLAGLTSLEEVLRVTQED